ncbi:Helix-turn-helix domain-containing protein [Pseudomonas sp. OF001]|uniref:helix-turn-helix domain-containing protein n=1 Tax=Pseudomonas sp. OF001 TaxID=2772300 RepID=UPI001917E2F2|nr:helix-turn-helix domain-containing protein [Pseudomonas sp. OF001]CAD5376164.1 Helix-turn-helix domain-containing protein [Pseudomonas sp. OF001]
MDPRIQQVVQLIDTRIHYGSDEERAALSVQALADTFGLSRFQLQRLFKRDTGMTLRDYLQNLQLEKAAVRVRLTRESLLSIALGLGFGSQQAFTRAFTRRWGMPPQSLRRLPAEGLAGPAAQIGAAIPARIVQAPARSLWACRYVGPYPLVPQHWQDFATRLAAAGLQAEGPFFGMVYDDPLFTPPERIRYACAIAAPAAAGEPPPGWYRIGLPPSRFVVFSIHCSYAEGLVRLRSRVHGWLARSGESFGQAGGFECYPRLPVVSLDQAQHMDLHCSLAG